MHSESTSVLSLDDFSDLGFPQHFWIENSIAFQYEDFAGWVVRVYKRGYDAGVYFQTLQYQPVIETYDQVIEEKDTVILSLRKQTEVLDEALSVSRVGVVQAQNAYEAEKVLRREETHRANTWRSRFWISSGVLGGVAIGLITALLM